MTLRAFAAKLLTSRAVAAAFSPLLRGHATILMAHRFHDSDRGVEGQDPDAMRRGLAYLRKERYELLSLEEVFSRLASGDPRASGAVAFTIDDGYADQAEVGARVFAEYDCPVTTFVTSGFLDGRLWMWWDRVEYVLQRTKRREVVVTLGATPLRYRLEQPSDRQGAIDDFVPRCKRVPDSEKHRAIEELAASAEVDLPATPPPEYAPMSWDDLRACERGGMSFGPHTVTHPILSTTTDAQARHELVESWSRLRKEAARPAPIFCYPNGTPEDFGSREVKILGEMGLLGAVVGVPGHADSASLRNGGDDRFRVPRFCHPSDPVRLIQYVSGIERCKELLRGESAS